MRRSLDIRAWQAPFHERAMLPVILILAGWGGGLSPARAADAPISVTVAGLRYAQGSLRVEVCTQATFLTEECPYFASAPASVPDTTVTVPAVPPGRYAIQAFHDINGNERVDRGPFGLPEEGIAFSRDAPLGLRGPSFAQAAFTHGASPQSLRLHLHRFRRAPPATADRRR